MTMRLVASCLALVFACSQTFAKEMPTDFQAVVDRAHAQFKDVKDGANADYIPILATVPSDMFGVVIVTRDGQVFSAGEMDYEFSIQSVSKPFTASLVMDQQG
ncbi:MAG: glutaminase, partial [Halieaceae bacterium]|nr:glutaminase [Halieaceae bacterium]